MTKEMPKPSLTNTYLLNHKQVRVADVRANSDSPLDAKKQRLVTPEQLGAILHLGRGAIVAAMDVYYEKQCARNSQAKDPITHPWVNAVQLCEFGNEAQVLSDIGPASAGYEYQVENQHQHDSLALRTPYLPYWEVATETEFGIRVLSHQEGWDRIHDGTWLQIHKSKEQSRLSGVQYDLDK